MRRWYVILAVAVAVLGAVALGDDDDTGTEARATAAPPTTVPTVEVPNLVGMKLASAMAALADRELRGAIRYRTTDRYRAGTVISQSRQTGAGVRPDSRITLVVAKAPPPPPTTAPPPPPTTTPERSCDPSYPDVCLDPNAADYDCAGGSGDGPEYVDGPVRVRPPDPFDLDREGDGWGCEAG